MKTRTIVAGAICTALAALFQSAPIFLSEIFVFITMLSIIPVYIISRISPKAGCLSYFAAGIIVMLLSVHEGILFFLTNGIAGLSLGAARNCTENKFSVWLAGTVSLSISLAVLNSIIGVPVFGVNISNGFSAELSIIIFFSLLYTAICSYFLNFIFCLLKKQQ